jgi:putative transposase
MARTPRIDVARIAQHVIQRGVNRSVCFCDDLDHEFYLASLQEASVTHACAIHAYVLMTNHVHLLVADQGHGEIAKSMQLVAGCTAQGYNRRKKRNGAFWEDRYHTTAVQSDDHLRRCLVYIDLNMVRAGVVNHPCEWQVSGYHEIQTPRPRKSIVDHNYLQYLLEFSDTDDLGRCHSDWIADQLNDTRRDPFWTESVGVGDHNYLNELQSRLGIGGIHKEIKSADDVTFLCEPSLSYKCTI